MGGARGVGKRGERWRGRWEGVDACRKSMRLGGRG